MYKLMMKENAMVSTKKQIQRTVTVSSFARIKTANFVVTFMAVQMFALGLASLTSAQVEERLRITEQERQRQFEAKTTTQAADDYLKIPDRNYTGFDTGGWYTINYFAFQDTDNDRTSPDALKGLILQDFRTWFNVLFKNDINLYVRFKKLRFDFQKEDGVVLPDTNLLEEVDLDLGFVSIPYKKTRLQLGRQFLQSGRGLVFSGVLDAASLNWQHAGLSLDTFYGSTPRKTHNIDRSIPGFDLGNNDRLFFNFQAAYQLPSNHRFYSFYTTQRDHSTSTVFDPNVTNFHYDSEYIGVGASGPISKRSVYYAESIWQSGEVLSSSTLGGTAPTPQTRDEVDAYSLRTGVNYFVSDDKRTVLSAEFAMGSGDADRADVITTLAGNAPGTKDKNFMYFGFYDGGLALSPRLSNMKVWRLGYSFKPFKRGTQVAETQIASIISFYRKDIPGSFGNIPSAISDPQSNLVGTDVGTGLDVFASSKIFSDLTAVARYGMFLPGSTFTKVFRSPTGAILGDGDDKTTQVSLTLTASF